MTSAGAQTRRRRRQERRRQERREQARTQEERIRGDLLRLAASAAPGPGPRREAMVRTILTYTVLGAVLLGVVGLAVGLVRPAYSASAVVKVVDVPTLLRTSDEDAGPAERTAAVQEAVSWLSGPVLAGEVRRRLGGRDVPSLSFEQVGTTRLVRIDAAASSRASALAGARAAVAAYVAYAKRTTGTQLDQRRSALEDRLRDLKEQVQVSIGKDRADAKAEFTRLSALRSATVLAIGLAGRGPTIVQPAALAADAQGPAWARYAAPALPIGGLLGALAGLALALARRSRPATIRRASELGGLGVPVLRPSLARAPADWADRVLAGRRPARIGWAAGLLLARLRPRHVGSVAVVGPVPASGATCAAVHLAAAAAQDGPTLLVCAEDLASGHDRTAALLGVHGGSGIAPFGAGRAITPARVASTARPTGLADLSLLVAGGSDDGPTDLTDAMRRGLLAAAAAAYRTVVVDVPPLASSVSGLEACAQADATVLVLGRGRTTPAEAASACETLRDVDATLAGVVLAGPPRPRRPAWDGSWRLPRRRARAAGGLDGSESPAPRRGPLVPRRSIHREPAPEPAGRRASPYPDPAGDAWWLPSS